MRPVVLIPGFGGSVLVRKGEEYYKPHPLAPRKVLYNRWVNLAALTSPPSPTWRHDMYYTVKKEVDKEGIERVVGFDNVPNIVPFDVGGTAGIKEIVPEFMYLNTSYKEKLDSIFNYKYFNAICESLYKNGYEDHVTLFGVPYDFRLVLDPMYRERLFNQFGKILTKSVHQTGEKAVVVSHSLGGLLLKWFLTSNPYYQSMVDHWVSISTPFGGSHYSLRVALCGDHYIPFFKATVREELARCSGVIMCFPNDLAFSADEPLARVGSSATQNISIKSYDQLALEGNVQFQIWRDLYRPYLHLIEQPINVPMTAVASVNNSTKALFSMKALGEMPTTLSTVEGDGIIVKKSLLAFQNMVMSNNLKDVLLEDHDHTSPLTDPQIIQIIKSHALPSRPSRVKRT